MIVTIRAAQISTLQQTRTRDFFATYEQLIRRHVGDSAFPFSDTAFEQECERLIERAHQFGLSDDTAVVSFIVLGIRGAPYFYLYPPFHEVLTDPSIPAGRRIMQLFAVSDGQAWAEAALIEEH